MKNKDLQEFLQKYPDDIEVVLLDGGCGTYQQSIDIEKCTATIYPEDVDDDFMRTYHYLDSDDYWSFRRIKVDVLLID